MNMGDGTTELIVEPAIETGATWWVELPPNTPILNEDFFQSLPVHISDRVHHCWTLPEGIDQSYSSQIAVDALGGTITYNLKVNPVNHGRSIFAQISATNYGKNSTRESNITLETLQNILNSTFLDYLDSGDKKEPILNALREIPKDEEMISSSVLGFEKMKNSGNFWVNVKGYSGVFQDLRFPNENIGIFTIRLHDGTLFTQPIRLDTSILYKEIPGNLSIEKMGDELAFFADTKELLNQGEFLTLAITDRLHLRAKVNKSEYVLTEIMGIKGYKKTNVFRFLDLDYCKSIVEGGKRFLEPVFKEANTARVNVSNPNPNIEAYALKEFRDNLVLKVNSEVYVLDNEGLLDTAIADVCLRSNHFLYNSILIRDKNGNVRLQPYRIDAKVTDSQLEEYYNDPEAYILNKYSDILFNDVNNTLDKLKEKFKTQNLQFDPCTAFGIHFDAENIIVDESGKISNAEVKFIDNNHFGSLKIERDGKGWRTFISGQVNEMLSKVLNLKAKFLMKKYY